jgi:aminopeptidase N
MHSARFLSFTTGLLAILSLHAEELTCGHGQFRPPPQVMPGSGVRRYAPDRRADLLNLVIEVTPDFKQRSISAMATLTFKPIGQPLAELSLDGIDFNVSGVESTAELKGHQVTKDKVILTFAQPLAVGVEQTVTLRYTATPKDGLYFRTPEQGYKEGDSHLFTQGETILARNWFPVLDSPNEKLTTEVICHLPDGMKAYSNGRLISEKRDAATGLTAYDWKQEKPHSAYLVSLVAGQFAVIEDHYKDLPMAFMVPPSDAALAQRSFDETKDIMAFFEGELDFPFAWEKYDQIVVRDFQWGGMENTSVTTLTDRLLHTAEYESLRSSVSIVGHELAHQWFGDVVTCKDWSTLWLNEGFATYYDALYQEHLYGHEQFLYDRWHLAGELTAEKNLRPIVFRKINADGFDQFGNLSYGKGSWVMHMIRSELGPELFRKVIQTYLKRYQFQNVVTENLLSVLEEVTGRSYDGFFDQWVYHGGYPELVAAYDWDEKSGQAHISLRQTQKISEDVLQFRLPVTVRFKGDFGTVDKVFQLDELSQDFHVSLPGAPKIVRLDPEVALLAEIDFSPTHAMLEAQLADGSDAMGRVMAMEKIARDRQPDSITKIQRVLDQDPLWFVRVEAARALSKLEAFDALSTSDHQPDARVRKAAVESIGSFTSPAALDLLLKLLSSEQNPGIRESIIRALPSHPEKRSHEELEKLLGSQSLRNHLFDAAVAGIRASDDVTFIKPLFEAIRSRGSELESQSLGQALRALAYLSRHESDKAEVFEFLLKQLESLRKPVANAAAMALGELADPRARPVLEALKAKPGNEEAEAALKTLDQGPKPPEALTEKISELEKSNQLLTETLAHLKKPSRKSWWKWTAILAISLLILMLLKMRRFKRKAATGHPEETADSSPPAGNG